MPLPIPNLDDRTYDNLVVTLRKQIPGFSKIWSDHNISDPGITILELFCWLAEMVIYRVNQVTERNIINFLKLVLDPPVPVTAKVKMKVLPQATKIDIPLGTKFIAVHSPYEEIEYETFQQKTIDASEFGSPPIASPPEEREVNFNVRNVSEVFDELLGESDGTPNQLFSFKKTPVLIDEDNVDIGGISDPFLSSPPESYNPNPKITVAGESWIYVKDFLGLDPDTAADAKCFMVERLTNKVRFGDGKVGKIPELGAEIRCERYQIIRGNEVKIGKDTLKLRDPNSIPGLDPDSVNNLEAEGGLYIYPFKLETAQTTGLQYYREPFRAVTEEDFEFIVTEVFNNNQVSKLPQHRVARAKAVPKRDFSAPEPDKEREGEISIIILPQIEQTDDSRPNPSQTLIDSVWRFLDQRRLITTRHHVVGPKYVSVNIDVKVSRKLNTLAQTVWDNVKEKMTEYLHPLTGGPDGNGWPFGRNVYKSELFEIIEKIDGIDHVKQIIINGDPVLNDVEIGEQQLVYINNLIVTD